MFWAGELLIRSTSKVKRQSRVPFTYQLTPPPNSFPPPNGPVTNEAARECLEPCRVHEVSDLEQPSGIEDRAVRRPASVFLEGV